MKIILYTIGTKCDFYQSLVFAVCLRKYTQHEITFLTNESFRETVEKHGLRFAQIRTESAGLSESPELRQVLLSESSKKLLQTLAPVINQMFEYGRQDVMRECQGKELIISCPSTLTLCITVSEKLKIPLMALTTTPMNATEQHPHFFAPRLKRTKKQNMDTFRQFIRAFDTPERKRQYNQWREEIGLKPLDNDLGPHALFNLLDIPIICLFSSTVLGGKPSDWNPHVHLTGFPTNPPFNFCNEQVDEELEQFLAESPEPPVLFVFGASPFPTEQIQLAVKVITRLKKRAVIGLFPVGVFPCTPMLLESQSFISELSSLPSSLPSSCYVLKKQVKMQKLLPRCSSVVHHASSVFTSFVLDAGVPHVPVVYGLDQPFWGSKLMELGVSSSVIHHKELNEENLSQALVYVGQQFIQQRAREVKELLQLEGDPIHRLIEAFLQELPSLRYVSIDRHSGKPILRPLQ
eukprot:TRINITY_DN4970_c0_g1_i1.p1 TRINITY_DN4970_c0_g1~~TRINITY_DN4970_c0_g1_i1.p1  ORF type:complete len:463 (+),score=84.32 TRINITY_DN4970_c0_g1_i1:177-1565(+)